MALDFQSKVSKDQKEILSSFADEEIAKKDRKKTRLAFMAGKLAAYRDALDDLQTEDLKYVSSTTVTSTRETPINYIPPVIQEKTLAGFNRQTEQVSGGVPRAAPKNASPFTRPLISASVDDVKTPLLEAIKGRLERLEYAIRRAADRTEVVELRSAKQDTLQSDVGAALKKIETTE